MPEPKKPQDHKPKTEKPKVTENEDGWKVAYQGVVITILRESLDDFELLDDLAALQSDEKRNAHRLPMVLRRLAGDEGFRAVTDVMRQPNGRVPIIETTEWIMTVFGALNPNS